MEWSREWWIPWCGAQAVNNRVCQRLSRMGHASNHAFIVIGYPTMMSDFPTATIPGEESIGASIKGHNAALFPAFYRLRHKEWRELVALVLSILLICGEPTKPKTCDFPGSLLLASPKPYTLYTCREFNATDRHKIRNYRYNAAAPMFAPHICAGNRG